MVRARFVLLEVADMRRYLLMFVSLLSLYSPVKAADSTVSAMTAASAFGGTELTYIVQGGADRKGTPAQFATYVYGLASGDCTISGGGAVVCLKTNGVAFGTFATQSVPTGSTQCLHANSSGVVSGTGADCGSGSGAVSSVTAGIGVTVSPTTGAVVVSAPATRRDNTATTDTITSADKGAIVTESNAGSVAVAITTAGFVSTDFFTIKNKGAGLATYTPSSGTINGAGTITCGQNQSADLYFDGTNYQALSNTCQLGALATIIPGTGVAAAAANALSSAGGLTSTIASGTAALGTSAIASGACATVVTVSATNTATTDVVHFGYNSDPTAVTGYGASATGAVLSIYPYPTSNNVNVKVCNSTASSITPGAMTLNWQVTR